MTATVTSVSERDGATSPPPPPPVARLGVGVIVAVAAAVLLWASGRYGFFGDELYFRASGARLAPSFADNGPAVPAIAHLMDSIAPDSLVMLRLPAVLLTLVGIVVTALTARELGGGRGAQTLAAGGFATGLFLLGQATTLSTNVVDIALWTVITWLLVRWVRTRSDRLLLLAALVTAADLQVKWLVPFLWAAVAVSVLLLGPRALLRRPALWIGAVIVVASVVPSLLWQAAHGWPQLGMSAVVAAEQDLIAGRWTFVPLFLASAGLVGALLAVYGTWRLLRSPDLRAYRFLGLVVLLVLVAFVVTNGRSYYPLGVVPVAMAAGAVEICRRRIPSTVRWVTGVPVLAGSVALAAVAMPWQPVEDISPAVTTADVATNMAINGKLGWPTLAAATTEAYRALPPDVAARTVVLTDSYWQASALDQLAPGLPVYGTGRGYWYFGIPPATATSALYVGERPPDGFASVRRVRSVDDPHGMAGATHGIGIWLAEGPRQSWPDYWARNNAFR